MLGFPVAGSSASPFLRKSGSRAAFFDLGAVEPGSAAEGEGAEMKTGTSPMHAVVMMPSPTFLFRFKVFLFILWCVICCKIGWNSVMRMDAKVRNLFLYEAFLYYNPLLLVTLMLWLWGANLWVFENASVNYAKVFELGSSPLTYREIWKSAVWITILVSTSTTAYLYLYSHKEELLAASLPVTLYAIVLMVLIFPFDIFFLSSRYYFLRTLWRIIFPLQAISFSDFFLADILTSMSKVLSDLERSVCRMVNRQVATIAWLEADSICGSHSVAIPLVLVLPYMFRFFQCLRQYKDTSEKTSLLNALKYATAVPVIFLSALKYHVLLEKWTFFYRPLWLLSSVVNSLYSFYWDVTRDWDLNVLSRIFKFKSPSHFSYMFYGRRWVYYWVLGSNLILRCTWTYKLSAHLRHNYLTVFTITALEIFRRFQWVFFRVENELNRTEWIKGSSRLSSQAIPMGELSKEGERLLGSGDHDV